MTDHQVFRRLAWLGTRGIPACLATITSAAGSTPLGVGARMVVLADGTSFGSVGGGCVEGRVRTAAIRLLVSSSRQHERLAIDLSGADGAEDADVCGGRLILWLEVYPPASVPETGSLAAESEAIVPAATRRYPP